MLKHTISSAFIASAATLGLLASLAAPAQAAALDGDTVEIFVGRSHRFTAPWDVAGASLTDPSVADVQVLTTRMVVVNGTAPGTTDVILWNDEGETHELRVDVTVDTARLESDLKTLFPNAKDLKVTQSQGVTIIEGTFESPDDAMQLSAYLEARDLPAVNRTRIPGVQQVQAKIRFAEVSRTGLRELGVNMFKSGDTIFGGSLIGGSTSSTLIGAPSGAGLGNTTFEFLGEDLSVGSGVTLFAGFPKADFQVFLNALAENNYVRVMAEPTLVALSGEEANFLAGGEFPIPVVQGGGGSDSISIEFKEFGISLGFRPVVLGDGRIRLRVRSEVSERREDLGTPVPGVEGLVVPGISARSAETTLEMASGQSFAMAGLLNETTTARRSQIPGLGDIPILGTLFRSVSYQRGETELLVVVTVDVVEPLDDQAFLPMPGELHEAPSDWEFYGQGKLEKDFSKRRITASEATYVHELGLDGLKGPGSWAYHGQPPARPRPAAPLPWATQAQQAEPVDGQPVEDEAKKAM